MHRDIHLCITEKPSGPEAAQGYHLTFEPFNFWGAQFGHRVEIIWYIFISLQPQVTSYKLGRNPAYSLGLREIISDVNKHFVHSFSVFFPFHTHLQILVYFFVFSSVL